MTDDRVTRIQQRILGVQQEMLKVITEEIQSLVNDLLKDALNPRKLMDYIRSMGVDMSQLPGMMGQQPGLDPYQILGLDKSASDEEIKKRYRELLHKLHPDTAGVEGTSFLLQMVMAAHEMIRKMRGWQ